MNNQQIAVSDEPMRKVDHKAKSHGKPRKGERLGGGHFVFKRNNNNGRVHPSPYPFEHANLTAANKEAERLQKVHGGQFDVLSVSSCVGFEDDASDATGTMDEAINHEH